MGRLNSVVCEGFNISVRYAIQIIAAFLHPGQPMCVNDSQIFYHALRHQLFLVIRPVMYANLFGNSTSFQTLYMLQGRSHSTPDVKNVVAHL